MSTKGLDILIVEDDDSMADVLRFSLSMALYQCTHVRTGAEALALLAKKRFYAVISDIDLNSKMSGVDLFMMINKQRMHSGAFVFMTGNAVDWSTIAASSEVSPTIQPAMFLKPFSTDRIVKFLNDPTVKQRTDVSALSATKQVLDTKSNQQVPPALSPDLSKIRHDIANKTMIALEMAQIASLLIDRTTQMPDTNKSNIKSKLEACTEALDELATILDHWRKLTGGLSD